MDHKSKFKTRQWESYFKNKENFCDLGIGKDFLDTKSIAPSHDTKKNYKLDFIKSKNFCYLKDTIKNEKNSYKLGGIFPNYISDQEIIPRI